MAEAVIFDMDGVLVNSESYHFEVERLILKKMGFTITDDVIHSFVGLAMDKMWERIKKRFSIDEDVNKLIEKDTVFRVNYFKNVGKIPPIEGVKNLIEGIISCGMKIAVASSSHPDLIKTVLTSCELIDYFPLYLSGFQVKHGKPDPDIFLKTAATMGAAPSKSIVIEDSHNGITAAKRAGMKCIGYQNPSSGNQDLSAADLIIKKFSDITPDYLKNF
jgi:HAD superfamily hydrolase (TIGR01509 family)